ncbi:D-alanyl-D-alanine carboxypeptidase/D-alanyl-D-alanine-endopeptidase [Serinibacter arcticus]|uniref:D-alanyl-D-alanine carboxypeptidase/D-alanyl-D-alanine endopeptidase n=1 Tax=Serinibacter arcticus TaxID=1655435 RepID=UPI001304E07F|nr:D-alanyl-D-alanine carboxypeptidase/D-alanyl-D-alanine-endopeptidase [Serinibacter arcticus]
MTAATVVAVVGLGAGYVAADGAGVVPGPFTTAAPWPTPEPFPTPSPAAGAPVPLVLRSLDEAAPTPTAAALQSALDALRSAPEVGTPPGVLVVDVATGETVTAADETTARLPASTTKVLTAAAAVATLDLTATLPTTARLQGADELVLVGGGDIALAAGAGDPTAVVGRAGLGDLAAATATALAGRGVTSVSLGVDDSLFGGGQLAPGWSSIDYTGGFVAPVQPLGIDVGLIAGRDQRDTDPADSAARVFAEALRAQGIEVREGPSRRTAAADATELARVESASIGEILDLAMADSDNTLTEVIGRLVAVEAEQPATFDGAATAILAAIANLGVDVSGTSLNDASGLSSSNRVSPRLLTDLLLVGATNPAMRELALSLPVAGLEGTLTNRDLDAGQVRAKTGTLPGVVSLAGYTVTADGRALAFTVMADGVPTAGSYAARLEVDEWVRTLTACGCS